MNHDVQVSQKSELFRRRTTFIILNASFYLLVLYICVAQNATQLSAICRWTCGELFLRESVKKKNFQTLDIVQTMGGEV